MTGVGKDFCVGADLKTYIPQITELQSKMKDGARPEELGGYRLDDGVKAVLRGTKLYKPVIAAVNGTCVAGGMEMLGGTDLRVASDTGDLRRDGAQAWALRRWRHDRTAAPPDPLPGRHGVPALRRPDTSASGPTRWDCSTRCADRPT